MILNLRGGRQVEYRAFALTDMVRYGYGGLRNLGQPFGESAARGIPALNRAARIRAEALASLKLRCWSGEGPTRKRMDNVWQAKLFAKAQQNEYQTRFGLWETVGESLAWRNNAYVWKLVDPDTFRVIAMYALHPDQVKCKPYGYEVTVRAGYVDPVDRGDGVYRVDDSTILHIRGHGHGGMLEAPTPIEVFKEALMAPVERQRHEARMWRRGTALQLAVEFPQSVTQQQAADWRETWRATYEGTDGETTAVLGGGGVIKPIGMSTADAKFVEMAHLTVEDAARIMGVPANLLMAPSMTSVQRASLEEDLMSWFRFGLGPDLERLEAALAADEQLFGTLGRAVYAAFDTEAFVRGDLMTEATILQTRVQAGILTPDEARRILGYQPLPNGVGKIPQITPVGGAPNAPAPKATEPATPVLNGR